MGQVGVPVPVRPHDCGINSSGQQHHVQSIRTPRLVPATLPEWR